MLSVEIQIPLKHFRLSADFSLKNEFVTLVGKSGSGKTTILNAIAGLIKPEFGEISINEKVVFSDKGVSVPTQKRNIGYVFQDYALFPHMTVEKNIFYGVTKSKRSKVTKHVDNLLNLLDIKHLINRLPMNLSGGEKQRVALIRALANRPHALLLDEPFSALDNETRIEARHALLQLKHEWDIPVIMVTHDLNEAETLGDRQFEMKNGLLKELF